MSNTRTTPGDDISQTSAQLYKRFRNSELFRPVVQTALTIPAVVTVSYPFEVLGVLKQTGAITSYRFGRILPIVSSNWRAYGRAYFTNYTQAGAKNAVVTNHSDIHTKLKDGITPKNDGANNTENASENSQPEFKLSVGTKIGLTATTALCIASADFLATQYWSNKRLALQINQLPTLTNLFNKIHFASLAGSARFAGLFINASGVVSGSALLRDPVEALLPTAQYGILNPMVSAMTPAFVTGPALNFCHVIRANQIKEMNPATMETPAFWATAKKLYHANNKNLSVFMRGGLVSVLNGMAVYAAMGAVDYLVNERLFPEETNVSSSSQAFFAPKTSSTAHTETTSNDQSNSPANRK